MTNEIRSISVLCTRNTTQFPCQRPNDMKPASCIDSDLNAYAVYPIANLCPEEAGIQKHFGMNGIGFWACSVVVGKLYLSAQPHFRNRCRGTSSSSNIHIVQHGRNHKSSTTSLLQLQGAETQMQQGAASLCTMYQAPPQVRLSIWKHDSSILSRTVSISISSFVLG